MEPLAPEWPQGDTGTRDPSGATVEPWGLERGWGVVGADDDPPIACHCIPPHPLTSYHLPLHPIASHHIPLHPIASHNVPSHPIMSHGIPLIQPHLTASH